MKRGGPRYDIVLAIRRFQAREQDLHLLLRPLEARLDDALLLAVDIYYRTATDVALLVLHVDARFVTGPLLETLRGEARRGGAAMFEIDKMSAADRERFFSRNLPAQDIKLQELPTAGDAARVLAERLGMRLAGGPIRRRSVTPPSVRFRRGDIWQRGRLCRITAEGAYIATGGPPRMGDRADIEVVTPAGRVVAPAITVQVTPPRAAAALGAAGFAARFKHRDAAEQRAFTQVLGTGRGGALHLEPPPKRRHTRFPVRWPAFLAQGARTTATRVLDVSEGGLFLETTARARSFVHVLLRDDERGEPLRLGARVAREVIPGMRGCRGIDGGLGLKLEEVAGSDAARYRAFLGRVQRRSKLRVVVGAAPQRLDPLIDELASAGYLVSGGSAPRVLFDRIVESHDPPDLVLVDETIEDGNIRAARPLQRALSSRSVQTLRLDDQRPTGVRHLVDAALVAN